MGRLTTQAIAADSRYFNREVSWLRFNRRVLEEAEDERSPLLERARFLAIVSSNLDEFCMVRLARLYLNRLLDDGQRDAAGFSRQQHLDAVRNDIRILVEEQYLCWNQQVRPLLAEAGIQLLPRDRWNEEDLRSLAAYYHDNIEPVLTPMAVDAGHPFPLVANQALYVACDLTHSGMRKRALVAVPAGGRLVPLPARAGCYVLLEDVVAHFLDSLFPGSQVHERLILRVTRDGAIDIDEDQAIDLLSEIEEELRQRAFGDPVRLEISSNDSGVIDEGLASWLQQCLELEDANVFRIPGALDLRLLFELANRENQAELQYPSFEPQPCPVDWSDPFATLRQEELFLHHPFQSFSPVVELVQRAARDRRVRALKMTLYRVSGNSPIVRALAEAARAGKQVTVLVELKARFDEEANIRWARRLEEAGAHVVYGIAGLKVHCKLLLIIRQDDDGIRRYCHLGTGNYNDKTARLYTDFSYLTSNEAVGRDVSALFNMLTGFARPPHWERMAASPYTMRATFVAWIRREAEHARAGRPAAITAKFNSLVDVTITDELYAASQAGVPIQLYVRGICILRPGVPGLSDSIQVSSVIGRFLEHSRAFRFANGGDPVYAISSADWMERNLDRRVEHLVQITEDGPRAVMDHLFAVLAADNRQLRTLHADGRYERRYPADGDEERGTQHVLMAEAAGQRQRQEDGHTHPEVLKPLRGKRRHQE